MSSSKHKSAAGSLVLAAALAVVLPAPPARAAYATEFTQIANNFQLGAELQEQIATVTQLVQTYKNQLLQLKEQIAAGVSIGGITLADVGRMQRDIEAYQWALRSVGQDLRGLGKVFDTRITEARILRMPLQDYMLQEERRIQAGNLAAKARVDREMQLIEQTKADIMLAKHYGDQVSNTKGVHAAQGLMNQQLNLALQQLNKLVLLKAEAQGSDKARELAEEAAERAAAQARMEQLRQAQEAIDARTRATIERMKAR